MLIFSSYYNVGLTANEEEIVAASSYPLQCIVISLKGQFFEHADGLVGVSRSAQKESSVVNSLDLRKY